MPLAYNWVAIGPARSVARFGVDGLRARAADAYSSVVTDNSLMDGYEAYVKAGSAVIAEAPSGKGTVLAVPNVVLGAVLGSGANGIVFRGEDALGRPVSVKLWPPRLDPPRSLARVQDQALAEARKVGRLKRDSIATVYVADRLSNGWPYTVSEYMPGVVLRDVRDSLSREARRSIVLQVLEALRYAEENGVLHGDLHDRNVVVERGLVAYVIDFGTSAFAPPVASEKRHARLLRHFVWQLWPELDEYLMPLPTLDEHRGAEMLPVLRRAVDFVLALELDRKPRPEIHVSGISRSSVQKTSPVIIGYNLGGLRDFDLGLLFERLSETYSSEELAAARRYMRAWEKRE